MKKDNISYENLKESLSYLDEDDIKLVDKAYNFACERHEGQQRRTGEPYIIHPLNVAYILTTIKADKETICASLLHDVLEDTNTSLEELEKIFGKEITKLVDGVTKINNINISTENEYLTSYYKKIIVGMSEDVRVIIIKLADRLHNMRTLYALPVDKQKKKAKETLEILAPIAHRLGMHKIKSELEDLSLKYLKPEIYFDIAEKLNTTKVERDLYVNNMMEEVSNLLKQNKIKHEIKGRSKSIYSIYKKLDKGRSFNDIYDLLAIRILVEKEQECYLALGLIHSKYKPIPKRFKDYIAMPKTNLYQTLHTTVIGPDGNLFEIQIRTYDMDKIAENGIASHWAYKEGKNAAVEMQNITEQKLQFYKSIIELNEEKLSNEDFVNTVTNEVLNNSIYVYTPKGDVIELPKGSTPIDFAYRVHSEVGDKTVGAIVNNNMVPLSYELKNTDVIKIITNKASNGPSREWLNIATTTQAKNKIKAFFNKTSKEDYINSGKEQLEKELRRKKVSITEFMKQENIDKILKEYKLDSIEDLYLNIGNGKYSVKSIIKEDTNEEEKIEKPKKITNNNFDNDIIIGDSSNIKTHIASCCYPVPGDDIIGYITKTNGISIHRKNCINIETIDEKIINAKFNKVTKNKYYTELIVYTSSNENILFDIMQAVNNINIQVESINIISKSSYYVYLISLLVNNVNDIDRCIKEINKVKYVTETLRKVE